MKSITFLTKTLIMAVFFSWGIGARAQTYEMDQSNPLITNVSTDEDTQLSSNCTWKVTDPNNDNCLEENNFAFWSVGNWLATLVDGSTQTYWHSDPDMDMRNTPEWIQVDLKRTDVDKFYLYMMRREDHYSPTNVIRYGSFPTKMEIMATNTPKDDASWKLITSLTGGTAMSENVSPYTALVKMDGNYQYIRIVCKEANNGSGNTPYWTFSELQMYPVKMITDGHAVITTVIDSLDALGRNYVVGVTPGYFTQADVDNYTKAYTNAQTVNANSSATNDELLAAANALRKAAEDIMKNVIVPTDGYYYIVSAYTDFESKALSKMMMRSDSKDSNLHWGAFREEDPYGIFHFIKKEDGTFSVQNGISEQYINTVEGDARVSTVYVPFSKNDSTSQTLTLATSGIFYVANASNNLPYHCLGHQNGSGKSGNIVPASVYGDDSPSAWTLVAIDKEVAEKRIAEGKAKLAAQQLTDSLLSARALISDMMNPANKLITSADQLNSNTIWQAEYGCDKLIDGNHLTYFHSNADAGVDLHTQDQYLQAELPAGDVSKIILDYWGRSDGLGIAEWHDTPNDIVIKAANSLDIDDDQWVTIAHLDRGFPRNVHNAHYVSPVINLGQAYKYIRMYIKETTSGNRYWNLSEFQIYSVPVQASADSRYSKVPEIKAAVDALQAALNTADDHIDKLTVDGTEMKAVNDAQKALNGILDVSKRISKSIEEAKKLNKSLYVAADGLITTVNTKNDGTNQLWANHTWTTIDPSNDNYSYNQAFIEDGYNLLGTLIDNDDQTYWHSDPINGDADLSKAENYLQIDLKRSDVKSFYFEIDRRNDLYNGTHRHGITPYAATIYGTNDETLASDINGTCDKWTRIANISNIPNQETENVWPYYTQDITPSEPYRFLRFRAIAATQAYWTISGFQVFESGAYNKEKSQYSYVEGMKEAADNMMNIVSQLEKKVDDGIATATDEQQINDAIAAVRALYRTQRMFNTNDSLIAVANNLITNLEVGTEMGQLKDASSMDALKAAKEKVEGKEANTAVFKNNQQALIQALDKVYDNVVTVKPDKWYYITNCTTEGDAAPEGYYPARDEVKGSAIYVISNEGKGIDESHYNAGDQLRWGMDDLKGKLYDEDPAAMWRFVKAPDSLGTHIFYIQNLLTGYYFGKSYGPADSYFNTAVKPSPYRITALGKGQFAIVAMNNNTSGAINAGNNARQIRTDYGSTRPQPDTRCAWTFQALDETTNDALRIPIENQHINIVTLPFAASGIMANNDGFKTYAIHSQPDSTSLALVEKQEFAAGEPFVLVIDSANLGEGTFTDLIVDLPQVDLTTKPLKVNGLNGVLNHANVKTPGLGYFEQSVLKVTTGKKTVSSNTGYIDPRDIVAQSGDYNLLISTDGKAHLDNIVTVKTDNAKVVDVYTIDGKLIKKSVKAENAQKGLVKGLYIIGKKKVAVK